VAARRFSGKLSVVTRIAKLSRPADPVILDRPPSGDVSEVRAASSARPPSGDVSEVRAACSDRPPSGDDSEVRAACSDRPPSGDDSEVGRASCSDGPQILGSPQAATGIRETRDATLNAGDRLALDNRPVDSAPTKPREMGGRSGPEPTRYGDWELKGRCIDF
jgi:hypothetical protein